MHVSLHRMLHTQNFSFTTESNIGPVLGNLPSTQWVEQYQTKVFVLNKQHHLDSTLYYLQKGWTIEFHLGPTLLGTKVELFTNYPPISKKFDRNSFQQLVWKTSNGNLTSGNFTADSNLYASVPLNRAGAFFYYFTGSNSNERLGSGFFIVDPVMSFGINDVLALNTIKCQTVLAKSLGPFEKWENCLRVSKESGYNMIHFTPIQELGGSNSSYSLKNQLELNPAFNSANCTPTFEDVFNLISKMRQEWKVLSLGDVVLNHTANESPWLQSHPECTYNMVTAPHLVPAAILDGHLHVFTKEISQGKFEGLGIPKEVYTASHLQAIKNYLKSTLVPNLCLYEFYTVNVEELSKEFIEKAKGKMPTYQTIDRKELVLIKGSINGRNNAKVDLELALKIFNICRNDSANEERRLLECAEEFKKRLYELNAEVKEEIDLHLTTAIDNCIANMRYFRIQEDGPKIKAVSVEHPLVPRYFTGQFLDYESIEKEVLCNGQFVMAHNGWVMNSDPLKNFADSDSNVYLRRELIAWGDSVKLRYGKSYSDCPFLWDHMRKYVEMTAKIFDGIRLDNCHSTPLHVAEYLLDCARCVKPDLYVVAELFTNSDVLDNIFANRLGITTMVRESLNAYNSHELGRLIHRFGGEPVGNFCQKKKSILAPSIAHALFYDVTHDNPSPIEKKTVFDSIPVAALISMSCCATGSTRGFDELVPHHIDVVSEKRFYPTWTQGEIKDNSVVGIKTGIIAVKKILNKIHEELSESGFTQIFVDQMNENIIAVTRHNPKTHESIVLVSYTAFFPPSCDLNSKPNVRNLKVEGELCEILLEAVLLSKNKANIFSPPNGFEQDEVFINGLTDYEVIMKQNIKLSESEMLKEIQTNDEKISEFEFTNFVPGSIVIIRVRPSHNVQPALKILQEITESFLSFKFDSKIISIVSKLNLIDLNQALFRCCEEDSENGTGTYNVPGYGKLVYCGLQGFESVFEEARTNSDLGHPICNNLRQGDWMLDYVSGRLKAYKGTVELGLLVQEMFQHLRLIPRYLIPKYFEVIISSICNLLKSRAAFQMSEFVREGSTFIRSLAMGSVQCVGLTESAPLPPFSPEMVALDDGKRKVTMSAGLPHFATGYMRSWGRDTFISLRGLLLLTGRFEEAKYHILGYAACLRHGLIPNLLDRGVNARYNCRDAVWWWLYSITCYIELAPQGFEILKQIVSRIFPTDDCPPMGPGLNNEPLCDIMQESLNVHFKGLSFRERNAGPGIDAHMSNEGFNNKIGIDAETGFVFGGNQFNCGTWMDKMGSDMKTGNRGKPATPRDGSAVELVALCKSVVKKLNLLNKEGVYPYSGVEKIDEEGKTIKWNFKEWEEKISENFEKFFWIPENTSPWETKPHLIHRRLIYKDCLGASQPWTDYQLRPNFLIALTVAPEMVNPNNAWNAIKKADEILCGPLGIKTLDPADLNYNGNYHNDDNSNNPNTAHGFNYHQGPEWLWPVGFLLRAKLHFAKLMGKEELENSIVEIRSYLGNHYQEILSSHWRGLPELTNRDGKFCFDGCRVQAWSMACILEVLYDLQLHEKDNAFA